MNLLEVRGLTMTFPAGWRIRRGGIRHNDKGERLTLTLMTTAGNRSRELVEPTGHQYPSTLWVENWSAD